MLLEFQQGTNVVCSVPGHPWWHLSVGLGIGVAGCLGIVVPLVRDLSKIGKYERAFWVSGCGLDGFGAANDHLE